MKRGLVIVLCVTAILLISGWLYLDYRFRADDHFIRGANYMAGRLRDSASPGEQVTAVVELNKRFHGYTVEAFDASGSKLTLVSPNVWNAIQSLRIEFNDSDQTSVMFDVLDPRTLSYVFGE